MKKEDKNDFYFFYYVYDMRQPWHHLSLHHLNSYILVLLYGVTIAY